ncbi:hypothetical protein BVX99_00245 [bacterium F16]|nr:hypothetical protein BVX99_00245 [bacterium F16]
MKRTIYGAEQMPNIKNRLKQMPVEAILSIRVLLIRDLRDRHVAWTVNICRIFLLLLTPVNK